MCLAQCMLMLGSVIPVYCQWLEGDRMSLVLKPVMAYGDCNNHLPKGEATGVSASRYELRNKNCMECCCIAAGLHGQAMHSCFGNLPD